jgi:hypothetical protein
MDRFPCEFYTPGTPNHRLGLVFAHNGRRCERFERPLPTHRRLDRLECSVGGHEVCFDNLAGPTVTDPAVPNPATGFWYLSRGENTCGIGTFGTQSNGSPRATTTCP